MVVDKVRDFADRVKKFYYFRADLCEKLIDKKIGIEGHINVMPPQDYNSFSNLYIESFIIACTALDGLSSIWETKNKDKT